MPDLDVPLQPSAEQIRRREFATVRRGYDPDQVRDYLYAVAEQLESLEREAHDAQRPVEAPAAVEARPATPAPDPYETFAKKMAGLLATADREAERLVEEAKSESGRIVEEARADADRIRVDAQARAEEARAEGRRLLDEARAEADRALSGLAVRRQVLVDQLQTMQERLLSAAKDLDVELEEPQELPGPIVEAEASATSTPAPAVDDEHDEIDPRYEDLWVSHEDQVELPDLTSIELDFDADEHPAS